MYELRGNSKSSVHEGVVEEEELQVMQDKFCRAARYAVVCLNAQAQRITKPSGRDCEMFDEEHISIQLEEMVARVSMPGSIEDVAIEEIYGTNYKAAAAAIKVEGQVLQIFVILADMSREDEETFYQTVDFLKESFLSNLRHRIIRMTAEAECRRSRFSEEEMSETLRRVEATTAVVQLLDSDESIEAIMHQVLEIIGPYLDVSSVQIYQAESSQEKVDVIMEWWNQGVVSFFEKTQNLPVDYFFCSDKPMVVSTENIAALNRTSLLDKYQVTAFIMFPLIQSEKKKMYISFTQTVKKRSWKAEEVKVAADIVKILQSIITKRIQKNSLASSYASLEAVLDNVGSGIYVVDQESKASLFLNRNFKDTFYENGMEMKLEELLAQAIPVNQKRGIYEIHQVERRQWYEVIQTEINWVDGRKALLYSFYDITDKKTYQKKIEQQAYTDFLTGLYNRMCCERDLAWHIDEAKSKGSRGALLYLDLDDFKHINDGLGHQYGDVLLKSISNSLQRINGIENTCYRMGGDEFVIVIPPENFEKFMDIVESIKRIFGKPWFLKDADYYCTMSMGVVNFPDDGESVQELIKKADIAMYEAKKRGKNRIANYSDNIETASNRRLDMEKNMRDATVAGYKEFEVYFQPIIDIQLDGTPCTGAEALIRWNSMELGFIPPSDFIPLAEYLGLINPIGNHVLKKACEACKFWNENGHPEYKVNVNLSVIQLLQPDIVENVDKIVKETGIRPHNLTLEVTESLAINDMDRMKEILGNIKKLGIRIALDDFGTGYSSLNHMREIPFDVIKVDQGFVKDLSEDAYSQSFIKMVAELADTIGVSICVEGIETKEQYRVLEGMKVRLVQGYYFDRPMTKEDFEKKYINKKC